MLSGVLKLFVAREPRIIQDGWTLKLVYSTNSILALSANQNCLTILHSTNRCIIVSGCSSQKLHFPLPCLLIFNRRSFVPRILYSILSCSHIRPLSFTVLKQIWNMCLHVFSAMVKLRKFFQDRRGEFLSRH